MKKYILLIFACIYAIHLNAQNAGINFLHGTTWAEAVAKAKAENKLIFIDFYTQWCGPCLNMAQTVFSLPTVGYYYNQTFINLKIDAEEGEGITLAKKYGVRSYPTYAFIIRKTKCFDFWERNVLFPKTKRSFFRTPTPLPCPFPLNFSLLIITKKFGNLAKNRYICIV